MDNQASAQPNLAEVLRILQAIEGRISRIEQERSDRGPRGGNGGHGGGNETGSRTAAGRTYAEATRRPPPRTHTPAARVDHGTTQGPRGGQESRRQPDHSDHGNRDFNQLAFSLYRICQLKHHGKIWNQLPAKLRAYLHEFFLLISPPMPDQMLSNDLRMLFNETADKVQQVVTRHLDRKLDDTKRVVSRCNPHAKEEAAAKARELLHTRLGRKIRQDNIDAWLDEALRSTGSGGESNPVHAEPPTARTAEERAPSDNSIVPPPPPPPEEEEMQLVTRKRKARQEASPQPGPITTSNRYASLDDETTPDDEPTAAYTSPPPVASKRKNVAPTPPASYIDLSATSPPADEEGASGWAVEGLPIVMRSQPTPPRHASPPPSQPLATTQPATLTNSTGIPTIHPAGNAVQKANWTVSMRPGAETLVLADSNFRRMQDIPDDWDVHVYPGANWNHGYGILSKYAKDAQAPRPKRIVLALGLNNRAQSSVSWRHDMSRCHSTATKLTEDTFVLGVSTTVRSSLSFVELRNIEDMNGAAMKLAPARFIPPLLDEEVNILANDLAQIHHTCETIEAIKMSIQKFLN